jgi:hypothetical protein
VTDTNSSNTIQANEQKSFYEFLCDFVCMARNRKSALVIRYFLEIIIKRSPLCETGSILVLAADRSGSSKEMNTLLVWTENDDVNSLEELREKNRRLPIDDGIAAMAFRTSGHPNTLPSPKSIIVSDFPLIPLGRKNRQISALSTVCRSSFPIAAANPLEWWLFRIPKNTTRKTKGKCSPMKIA